MMTLIQESMQQYVQMVTNYTLLQLRELLKILKVASMKTFLA